MPNEHKCLHALGPAFLDSYFVVDAERRIKEFNPAFVHLLGFRPAQRRTIQGTRCYELLKLEICKENCIALECLAKNAPAKRTEIRGSTPDGRNIVLEIAAVPLRTEDGKIDGVFVTQRDVTDERRLKEKFSALEKEHEGLKAKLAEAGESSGEVPQKPR